MSDQLKTRFIKYGFSALFVAVIAVVYTTGWDFVNVSLLDKLRLLSDAFAVPGILLMLFSGMIWASNQGGLDGLSYVLTNLGRSLIPGGRGKKDESYADYVERKRSKPVRGYGFLLISGGISLSIGIAFLIAFYIVRSL